MPRNPLLKVLHWSNGRRQVTRVTSDPDEVTEGRGRMGRSDPPKAGQPALLEPGAFSPLQTPTETLKQHGARPTTALPRLFSICQDQDLMSIA